MAMSGTPRPRGLCRCQSQNGLCQAKGANALVTAGILGPKITEEGGHRVVLVIRALKVGRESAPGEFTPDLRIKSCRTADASYIGTCEIVMVR